MGERAMFTLSGTLFPDDCSICGHPLDGHLFIAGDFSSFTRRDGQTVFVPIGGTAVCSGGDFKCDCRSEWSLRIPSVVRTAVREET